MSYSPALKARNTYGSGTRANVIDWKTGRIVECLSQGEKWTFLCLRWDDNVLEIREQYAMNQELVCRAALELGLPIPHNQLSTDFLVSYKDRSLMAVSVKNSEDDLKKKAVAKRQVLEKQYWMNQGVPWVLIYKSRINRTMVDNIRLCVRHYDPASVTDRISMAAHKIARKEILVDMEVPINFKNIADQYCRGDLP